LLSCFPFGVIVLFYRVSCLVSFYCNPCYTGLLPTLVAPPAKPQEKGTSYDQWQRLLAILQEQLPTVKVWNEFKLFAETALDFKELLKLVDPHIHFLRREETEWDEAFHLYSSLAFFHD
jgi:hypothetical protein